MDEAKVWQRVMGCAAASETPHETLLEWIAGEEHDCAFYTALARRTCGAMSQTLRAIAADERRHSCRLRAIYFAETGACACPPVAPVSDCGSLCELLRPRPGAELSVAEGYEAQGGKYAQIFRQFAADERRHADLTLQMLARYVCK